MSSLPSGTVTFVFSDIEGSTALLKQLGDRYDGVLSDHRRLMRESFTERGGVEIDTQGDAFFFAFPRARDAVAAAVEAQRAHAAHEWPDGCAVRVRMGLHTGEPAVGSEGYLGLDVVRAARLCTAGKGGHVLLSDTTRALVGASLPDGVSIFPLGERRLKDIDEPERVFELEIEGAAPPAPAEGPPDLRAGSPPPPAAPARPATTSATGWRSGSRRACARRSSGRSSGRSSQVDTLADRAAKRPETIAERLEEDERTSRGPRGRRAAASRSACAREESSEQSSGRVSGAAWRGRDRRAISSANSARETSSAPATCSGPATSSSASSSSAWARSVTWTGLRISFVKNVNAGSRAASSCFDGVAPP